MRSFQQFLIASLLVGTFAGFLTWIPPVRETLQISPLYAFFFGVVAAIIAGGVRKLLAILEEGNHPHKLT